MIAKISLSVAMFVLLALGPAPANAADYLDAGLRQQVEILKSDYRKSPTSPDNYRQRANVTWDWLNAYAMTGRWIPVNITAFVRPNLPIQADRKAISNLNESIEDMIFLDEQPNAIGSLTADVGPHEARAFVTIQQVYKVGERPVKTGGGFLVGNHYMANYALYQTEDPTADNYVSIASDNPDVSFASDTKPLFGMHGGFRGPTPQLFFRVSSGTLRPGDTVTITYGDTTRGGRGFQMVSTSTDYLPLPLYLSFDANDRPHTLPVQPVRVTGTKIASVHGFAPSVVRPEESFEISVRAEDRYYNRAIGSVPAFEVFANDRLIGTTPAQNKAIHVLKDVRLEAPGIYQITIKSKDGKYAGVGNPILVSKDAQKIYWGETHGHSGFAEGMGTPERFMQWAKEDARLDFVTHSEHDIWLDDAEWLRLIKNVNEASEPGKFVAYLGYEWTQQNNYGGHHNVLFRDTNNRQRISTQFYPNLTDLYTGLRNGSDAKDVLVIPHAHQAGDYRQTDPSLEHLVEIMSQHGTFEWFGKMYLKQGHQIGFVAASDNHLSQPGYTSVWRGFGSQRGGLAAVMADGNSRDQIFDAMKGLKTYATTGDRIIMDVKVNGTDMGQRAPFANERVITGRIYGTAPIDSITLVKNDMEIWSKDFMTKTSKGFGKEESFLVTFESESFPMHKNDNPRGTRGWLGWLEVKGADVAGFETTDFLNPDINYLKRDAKNPNKLYFVTGTRGDTSSIQLDLKNIKRNASIQFGLEEALESGSPTRFRPPKVTPKSEVALRFKDIKDGITSVELPIDVYKDRISLRHINTTGESNVDFEVKDTSMLQGDYYYVRVKQSNDAMAWSSPIWVGGYPAR